MATNPRSRNMVAQAAHATRPAQLQQIPFPNTGNAALDEILRAVKQQLDIRLNGTGNPFEQAALIRDLQELGLRGGLALASAPADVAGLPVWTSRGKFELLTASAMAALLQLSLTAADPEVTADQMASLRRQLAAIQPGASLTQVDAAIRRATTGLAAQWASAIDNALRSIRQQLSDLSAASSGAAAATTPVNRITLDLGNTVYSTSVTFDAPGTLETDKVLMWPDPSTDNGALGGDELECDGLLVAAECRLAGYITAYISANPGPVSGARNFFYQTL